MIINIKQYEFISYSSFQAELGLTDFIIALAGNPFDVADCMKMVQIHIHVGLIRHFTK